VLATLVLLHGFTQTRQSWRRTANELRARYRVIAPDLPGHGQSAHKTASFDACAAYVRALAPEVLVGYSMGGRIALYTALRVPGVRRLVLIGASPGLQDDAERRQRREADEGLADRIAEIGVEAFAREWAEQPLFAGQPQRVRDAAYADRLRNTPTGLANALRGLGTGVMPSLWDDLPKLTIPVTLITGERDEKFHALAERMGQRLPNAAHVTIPDAGHAAQLEQPAQVARAIYQSGSPSSSASA
jgi:2-succinyl-6-hydroxy-2,4-cyclohexadiene-1-carboxylate synthase